MFICTDWCPVILTGPYVFQRFEALQGSSLQPAAAEALKLLRRLAADPGIVTIMRAHRWTVGKLKEMPPEVKHSILAPHRLCPADPPAVRPKFVLLRLWDTQAVLQPRFECPEGRPDSTCMPASQGKVGVSAMCILGYNTNKGQEIALRLRTDDMQVGPATSYLWLLSMLY